MTRYYLALSYPDPEVPPMLLGVTRGGYFSFPSPEVRSYHVAAWAVWVRPGGDPDCVPPLDFIDRSLRRGRGCGFWEIDEFAVLNVGVVRR